MLDRVALARIWHARAQVTREQIFGTSEITLRPIAMRHHVDVSVPGMVGQRYEEGGAAIVSINPAGGKDGFESGPGDDHLYNAASQLRDDASLHSFEQLNKAFESGMPQWGAQWRVIASILRATGKTVPEIAYPYLVPYRSRGDRGSALPQPVVNRGYDAGFRETISALKPSHLIAVDRHSEAACLRARDDENLKCTVIYLTRQRDAHAQRQVTLKRLAADFESLTP